MPDSVRFNAFFVVCAGLHPGSTPLSCCASLKRTIQTLCSDWAIHALPLALDYSEIAASILVVTT